jgi:hypothetical protein
VQVATCEFLPGNLKGNIRDTPVFLETKVSEPAPVLTTSGTTKAADWPHLVATLVSPESTAGGKDMNTADEKSACFIKGVGEFCTVCREVEKSGYWCNVCKREVAEKRCPLCGLKARKLRDARERK